MKARQTLKNIYLSTVSMGLYNWIPDREFIQLQYRIATGEKLSLKKPITFNEKIQWIKLFDHNPLYTKIADKFEVRGFIKERIGEQYLIPLVGKYNKCADISFDSLPSKFVLKCNHDSGGVSICRAKDKYDYKNEFRKLDKRLRFNFYYQSREWAYKKIKPCIICEELLENPDGSEINDYKFFTFNGKVKAIQVDFDRFSNHRRNIYTPDFELMNLTIKCPNSIEKKIEKPKTLNEMIKVAETLSRGFPELRVDLYSVGDKVFFGEMTIYHGGGIEKFTPDKYGLIFGDWIDLDLVTEHE